MPGDPAKVGAFVKADETNCGLVAFHKLGYDQYITGVNPKGWPCDRLYTLEDIDAKLAELEEAYGKLYGCAICTVQQRQLMIAKVLKQRDWQQGMTFQNPNSGNFCVFYFKLFRQDKALDKAKSKVPYVADLETFNALVDKL